LPRCYGFFILLILNVTFTVAQLLVLEVVMTWSQIAHETAVALAAPLRFVTNPSKRLYWPFMLAALLIALVVLRLRRSGGQPALATTIKALFEPRLWLHRSTRLDLKLLIINRLLRGLLLGPAVLSTAAITVWTAKIFGASFSTQPVSGSRIGVDVAYTLTLFFADDITRFVLHRWMHRVPALWELHKVHHTAEVMTPLALYRTHPVESLLGSLRATATAGLVVSVFFYFFGASMHAFDILGINAIGFVFTLIGSNLRHSHVWLSYGRLEQLFISPAQHQIHHSRDVAHYDSNYGAFLAIWDRLGGSLQTTTTRPLALRFGLVAAERNHGDSASSAILAPLEASLLRLTSPLSQLWKQSPRRGRVDPTRTAPWALALALATMVAADACIDHSTSVQGGSTPTGFDRRAMLGSIGESVILARYRAFADAAAKLERATVDQLASGSAADRKLAQDAWREAMAVWQQAELYQLGPAGPQESVVGGESLRETIYSWPIVSACRVDQELVEQAYQDVAAFSSELPNVRGLAALEYLLFHEGGENACTIQNDINVSGAWAALDLPEIERRRAAYAASLAIMLAGEAGSLRDRWEPSGGNFVGQLATAGQEGSVFESEEAALTALTDAMFYIEAVTKDRKLAVIDGVGDCVATTCPDARESRHANASLLHLEQNLVGLELLFTGGPSASALGLNDLLAAVDQEQLASDLIVDIAGAIDAIHAVEADDLEQALQSDLDGVINVHSALRAVTERLKVELTAALLIEPPAAVQGDND
jgi:sterol desaturase/sphingolipid hydroxylase (fatty acid hydroxylase superfamily)/predicted lipoprotein